MYNWFNKLVPYNSDYLYNAVELARNQMSPMRLMLLAGLEWYKIPYNPARRTQIGKTMRAGLEIAERITRQYSKPVFGITETTVDKKEYKINQTTILNETFCHLQHFEKVGLKTKQPKLLIVAPMAGHHATLLRGTVIDTLPFFDVYITDWIDAKQVPAVLGKFDMDDFIDYTIKFIKHLGQDSKGSEVHVMAVCQPTVPVLAAVSIMSDNGDPNVPKSMILIGGPVDASQNPTSLNKFVVDKSIEWLNKHVVTLVPWNYPGANRRVYPGFLQLSGFMMLNLQRHINSHIDLFNNLVIEENAKAEAQKKFYDEYLSVMDLPAEFYLQTIKEVFHDFALAKGSLSSRGRQINLKAITKCALLGIEGEHDDIAAVGQTKQALKLCVNIPNEKKSYHLQKGVGHYGVFSGSKFRSDVVPVIVKFINSL